MGILISNKTISKNTIGCGETADVTLSLSASPDIREVPKEIVLVLDRSGSMKGKPFDALQEAALKFLDIIDTESDGIDNGYIGGESRVGLVSFATTAVINSGLSNSIQKLSSEIRALSVDSGSTNHKDAFRKAIDLLAVKSGKEKSIILFTDGVSNTGQEGFEEAEEAKAKGINVYVIVYSGKSKFPEESIKNWASSPCNAYSFITPELSEIETAFVSLVRNISKPGASDIKITDTISKCFETVGTPTATVGTVTLSGKDTVVWNIDSLGTDGNEAAECTFTIKHVGSCTGEISFNLSTDYADKEGNITDFPSPVLKVECRDISVIAEKCPEPVNITAKSCTDYIRYDIGDIIMTSQGRVLQLDTTVKNICPEKEVALAVFLYERDELGNEESRGMKTFVIPPHSGPGCRDIKVRCINFVVPEHSEGSFAGSLCRERNFVVRAFANYTGSDFECCN